MDMLGQEVFIGANVYDVDLEEDGETIKVQYPSPE